MTKHNLPIYRIDNIYGFFVSLIMSVFAFATLYFGLSTQIQLLAQKLDTVNKTQEIILLKFTSVETRYGELALKLERLQTIIEK